jgi:anti-anti-sigma regulatory factor
MQGTCQTYHLFVQELWDGAAVHPIGRLPEEGEWLLDQELLDKFMPFRRSCLYVDCSLVPFCCALWLANMLRLFKRLRDGDSILVLSGVCNSLREVLQITRLDKIVGVQTARVLGPRPLPPEPSWLTWNDGTVSRLARTIRAQRAFERMPILADALEEAGCTEADILDHCRSVVDHLPDCWVLGLLTVEA